MKTTSQHTATTKQPKGKSKTFFSPQAPVVQRQGNKRYSSEELARLTDPAYIRQSLSRMEAEKEAKVLAWLTENLQNYHTMDGHDLLALIKRQVPVASQLPDFRLKALVTQTARSKNINPPIYRPQTPPRKSSGPNLSGLTKFKFKIGATEWNVELPSSIKMSLPVELRNAFDIKFELKATSSGEFSFTIILDSFEHIKIEAGTKVSLSKNTVESGLTISSKDQVCRARNPFLAKEAIKKKGKKLTKAINELQNPTPPKEGEEEKSDLQKVSDVASTIGDIYGEVSKLKASCKPVPSVFGRFGTTFPMDGEKAREDRQDSRIEVKVGLRF